MSNTKPQETVLKHRILAGSFLTLHVLNVLHNFGGMDAQQGQVPFEPWQFLLFFFGILGSLYYLFNLFFFKWEYSHLGRLSVPKDQASEPLFEKKSSHGCVGWVHASMPFVSWKIYETGLSVKMMGVGEAFVALDQMESLKGNDLTHNSAVVRNPIVMPAQVAKELKLQMEKP